mmetsp:Transcript_97227/g.275057  ORF Transcript_97227/g.275057 Transcript_97227/m.275057 type:complete len:310 (+) Transcript_97227:1570-2499(+)
MLHVAGVEGHPLDKAEESHDRIADEDEERCCVDQEDNRGRGGAGGADVGLLGVGIAVEVLVGPAVLLVVYRKFTVNILVDLAALADQPHPGLGGPVVGAQDDPDAPRDQREQTADARGDADRLVEAAPADVPAGGHAQEAQRDRNHEDAEEHRPPGVLPALEHGAEGQEREGHQGRHKLYRAPPREPVEDQQSRGDEHGRGDDEVAEQVHGVGRHGAVQLGAEAHVREEVDEDDVGQQRQRDNGDALVAGQGLALLARGGGVLHLRGLALGALLDALRGRRPFGVGLWLRRLRAQPLHHREGHADCAPQ